MFFNRFLALGALLSLGAAQAVVPLPDDPACTAEDRRLIARTYELARESALKGNGGHGALLYKNGKILLEFASATQSTGDVTQHAETGLLALASRTLGLEALAGATLYTSEEPCMMCMGTVRAAGLHAFVYGTTSAQSHRVGGRPVPERWLECREVYERLGYPITIRGPLMEGDGLAVIAEHHARTQAAIK